ncbi:MAG: HD-GYP domain-containing protein [Bacillota bacterium]|nr:HD-GYP domain-containing protein [Bacillota bacterium]MDW7683923.1 HD-GYP domain-containing protein [Bacillota bacterium]
MRKTSISLLRPGMVLAKPVYGPDGQLWLNAGVELRSNYIASLWRTGIPFVYISDPLLGDAVVAEVISEETRRQAVKILKETLSSTKANTFRQVTPLVNNRFSFIVEKMVQEVLENKDIVVNLADIRDADDYTFLHSVNVCVLTLLAGAEFGLSRSQLGDMGVGALLHDMGKIWIDDEILKKKGSLTPEEFAEIKKHPSFGHEILSAQANISPDSVKIVMQHHERCDGSGYPYQLTTEEIHPYARLAMVVDVYDALTSDRPYRDSMKPHQAIEMITASCEIYDNDMVTSFLLHLAAYPVGSAVRLSSGDLALVVKNRKGVPLRPVVRVCKDGDGFLYAEPFDIDLTDRLDLVITDVLSDKERQLELPLPGN